MAKFNVKEYVDFKCKMDWEGGLGELINYGWSDSTGDYHLDELFSEMDSLMHQFNERMEELQDLHEAEIEKEFARRENE